MLLKYIEDYNSIKKFNSVELSDFSILTGVNGSGKTQLLEALIKGNVEIDEIKSTDIIYFDFTQFKIENESDFNTQQSIQERNSAWDFFTTSKIQRLGILKDRWAAIKNSIFSSEECKQIKKISKEKNKPLLNLDKNDFSETEELQQKFENYKSQFLNDFNNEHIKSQQFTPAIKALSKKLDIFLDEISEEEFKESFVPTTLKGDFLPMGLGKIFLDYRIKEYEEFIKIFENTEGLQEKSVAFKQSSEKCMKRFGGLPPWELINEFLNNFQNFDYEISFPRQFDRDRYFRQSNMPFSPRLKNNKKETAINFGSLSSGEQVLCSLALCLFKSRADNLFPKVLLLDEVDATLHPSMIDNLIKVIKGSLVKNGTKVILATHSPTTVALVPEESIFVVNREGENRIERRDRKSALEILTQGIVTLDKGLKIFDQISKKEISIITEGNNTKYIEKAIELFANDKKDRIDVITGAEGSSGDTQLKTLFNFFTKVEHTKKVIFIWDWDYSNSLKKENNTVPYNLPKNDSNILASKGIENMFDESFFEGFITIKKTSKGQETKMFDGTRKVDFMDHMISVANSENFKNFKSVVEFVENIIQS